MTNTGSGSTTAPKQDSSRNISRVAMIAAAGLGGIIVLVFILALVLALFTTDVNQTAARISFVRDLFIILLALEGILIIFGLAVLTIQIARLINLLQTEFRPILENTQETVKHAQGTVDFVSSTVTEPIVRAGGFFAGLSVFINNVGGIRRALEHSDGRRENGAR